MPVLYAPGIAPGDILVFGLDFTDALDTGDTLVSATVTATNSLSVTDPVVASPIVTCWVSGGTVGMSYTVTFHVTTSQGKTLNRSGIINCLVL